MIAELEDHLLAAGWTPERRVSISRWENELRKYEIPVIPAARSILTNYGGLHVEPVVLPSRVVAVHAVEFDPCRSWGPYSPISKFAKYLSCPMTPLAFCDFDFEGTLVVTTDGRFLENHYRTFWHIGNSLDEALEALLCGTRVGDKVGDLDELGLSGL